MFLAWTAKTSKPLVLEGDDKTLVEAVVDDVVEALTKVAA
jgi:hypothetical protein